MSRFFHSVSYDEINDILYLRFDSSVNSYGDEETPGIVLMKDMDTDAITGITVFYPKLKHDDREAKLKQLGYDIDLNRYAVCS